MTVSYRAIGAAVGTNTLSTLTPPLPTGTAEKDILLLCLFSNSSTTWPSPPAGAGWVLADAELGGTFNTQVFTKAAGAAEAAPVVTRGAGEGYAAFIFSFYSSTGKDMAVNANANQANTSSANRTCPAVTTTKASAGLACVYQCSGNNSSVPPGDMTENFDALIASLIRAYAMYSILTSAGATGTKVATGTATATRCVTVAVAELEPPTAPTTLVAVASAFDVIGLTWVDGTLETSYELEHCTDGVSWALLTSPAANATSYNHSGLIEHSVHHYRIRGANGDGWSAYAGPVNTTTLIKPPTTLAAVAIDPARIDLSWLDISGVESGYKIERSLAGAGSWSVVQTTTANVTSWADTTVSSDTAYDYRIRAYVGSDFSTYTSTATATTPLVAPTSLVATAVLSTKITLAWADSTSTEDGYKVDRSPEGTSWSQIGTTAANVLTYEDISLAPATIFYYRVRSYHGANHSAYSGTANATTLAALVAPTSLAALVISTSEISLSWVDSVNVGVDGFSLERSDDGVTGWTVIYSPTSSPQVASGLVTGQTYWFRIRAQRTG